MTHLATVQASAPSRGAHPLAPRVLSSLRRVRSTPRGSEPGCRQTSAAKAMRRKRPPPPLVGLGKAASPVRPPRGAIAGRSWTECLDRLGPSRLRAETHRRRRLGSGQQSPATPRLGSRTAARVGRGPTARDFRKGWEGWGWADGTWPARPTGREVRSGGSFHSRASRTFIRFPT